MMCEKCWADAYNYGEGYQAVNYRRLIAERTGDKACSPREQAGQWWDEEKQRDSRAAIDKGDVP